MSNTMLAQYSFENILKTPPMAHQYEAVNKCAGRSYFAYLMEMGTGKSLTLLLDFVNLYLRGEVQALLYFAPKGAYRDFCDFQIPDHMPENIKKRVLVWTSPLPKDWKEQCERAFADKESAIFMVMNAEALAYDSGYKAAYEFISRIQGQVMMAVDESTCIKNHKANRSSHAIKLGRYVKYRRILSGSPVTRSPMDMFGQALFLSKNAIGFSSYYAYRSRYAMLRDQKLTGGRTIQIITGYQRLEELKETVQQWSFRCLKSQCLDLPDKVYQYREVEMTDDQKRLYKEMAKNGVAMLDNGQIAAGVGPLTLLLRLHQITCGHIVNDEREVVPIQENRTKALMEVLEEISGKVIIWATYVHDIERIVKSISEVYGPETVVHYYGKTSDDDRSEAKIRFQNDKTTRFFVGNPSTGRYSLTLTAASNVVYYSNSYDLEHRVQSEDRAHRKGQTEKVTYIDLVIRNTMDEVIYKSLKMKKNIAAGITGDELREWLKL
jgi:hypothetical protein